MSKSNRRERRMVRRPKETSEELTVPARILHCWEDGPRTDDEEIGTTCMLLAGHAGPHEWSRDDGIGVVFADVADG